ncbi:MAG: hypothetical protein IJP03_05700 [Christensenellaceae bacterium]|nr:hypothetical protein [Christensenellaceae bacterium]
MQLARVCGQIVSTRKAGKLEGFKILVVQPISLETFEEKGAPLVSLDTVGAGEGEVVMIVGGSSARQTEATDAKPTDSSIVAIIDSVDIGGTRRFEKERGVIPLETEKTEEPAPATPAEEKQPEAPKAEQPAKEKPAKERPAKPEKKPEKRGGQLTLEQVAEPQQPAEESAAVEEVAEEPPAKPALSQEEAEKLLDEMEAAIDAKLAKPSQLPEKPDANGEIKMDMVDMAKQRQAAPKRRKRK